MLDYQEDDGIPIEPRFYLPVVPLVLINGATGIGTGYSTNVPSYKPVEVIRAVRSEMHGLARDPELLSTPWHRGFRGSIVNIGAGKARSRGIVVRESPTKVCIEELPIGYWTDDFKAAVEDLVEKTAEIRSVSNESTDSTVRFIVTFSSATAADAWMAVPDPDNNNLSRLEIELKLATTKGLATTNMHLFNEAGQIRKYNSAWDIVSEFVEVRRKGYIKRRLLLIERLQYELHILNNRIRFIESVLSGELRLDSDSVKSDMDALGLARIIAAADDKKQKQKQEQEQEQEQERTGEEEEEEEERDGKGGGFSYLLSMPMASMTRMRKNALDRQALIKADCIRAAELRSAEDEWAADLDALEALLLAEKN